MLSSRLQRIVSSLAVLAIVLTLAPAASAAALLESGGDGTAIGQAVQAASAASQALTASPVLAVTPMPGAGSEATTAIVATAPSATELLTASLAITHVTLGGPAQKPDVDPLVGKAAGMLAPTVLGAAPDLWTGNASYGYPIDLPAGPGGFTPQLSLVYSSEAANGMLLSYGNDDFKAQAGFPGYGWSLTLPEISRQKTPNGADRFFLSLEGRSYELVWSNAAWTTRPASALRIEHGDPDATVDYPGGGPECQGREASLRTRGARPWIITTPAGVRYQFGAYDPSQSLAIDLDDAVTYHREGDGPCGAGQTPHWEQVADSWRLVEARDPNGNRHSVTWQGHLEQPEYDYCYIGATNSFYVPEEREYVAGVRPTRLAYAGNHVTVDFLPALRDDRPDNPPDAEDDPLCMRQLKYLPYKLSEVVVKRDGAQLSRYVLTNNTPAGYSHAELTEIKRYGIGNVLDPMSTTFGYLSRAGKNGRFLQWVRNGYGGETAFQYATESAGLAAGHGCQSSNRQVVDSRTVSDGLGNSTRWDDDFRTGASVGGCSQASDPYEFLGFDRSTEVVYQANSTNQVVRRVVTDYYQKDANNAADLRKGKAYHQEIGDGSATVQTTDWAWAVVNNRPRLEQVTTTLDGVQQRTAYAYDSYDNVTHVREYVPTAGGLTLHRTTWTEYGYLTGSNYIVDRPKRERVYAGDVSGTCARQTEYDYGGGYGAAPVAPANRLGQRTAVASCTGSTYVETRYGFANGDGSGGVNGNLTSVVVENDANDSETRTTYQAPGIEVQSVTQENGSNDLLTTYTYDAYGRLSTTTRPNLVVQRSSYDPFGRPCLEERKRSDSSSFWPVMRYAYSDTDGTAAACPGLDFPDGVVTSGLGVLAQTGDDGAVEGYDAANGLFNVDPAPGGLATYRFYDGLGRAVTTQAERNHPTNPWTTRHQVYDALGQVVLDVQAYPRAAVDASVDTDHASVAHAYDALGRRIATTLPDGSQSTAEYGPDGDGLERVERLTDANAHRTVRFYNVLGKLVDVSERSGANPYAEYASTSYQYDVLGQLTDIWDNDGNHTRIWYDQAGRKTSMADPDMGPWYYKYDLAGNLTTQVDARSQAVCTSYDQLNRLKNKKLVSSVATPATYACPTSFATYDASFTYDTCANGPAQRCQAANATVTIDYAYDGFGRLQTETFSNVRGVAGSWTTGYIYDGLDRVNGLDYPDREMVVTTFDAAGQPYALLAGDYDNFSLISGSTYRPWGAPARRFLGNGLVASYDYDEAPATQRRWLTRQQVGVIDANGNYTSRVFDQSYGYDLVGNVVSIADAQTGEVQTYAYDHRDRLTDWWLNNTLQQHVEYSPIGNLTRLAGVTYTYPAAGQSRPHAVLSTTGGGSFHYDANGHMDVRTLGGRTYTQTWDGENRLASVASNGGSTDFYYDPDGNRFIEELPSYSTHLFFGNYYELDVVYQALAVVLASFDASRQGDHVLLAWETTSEVDHVGFNVYRSASPDGERTQVNAALIPSQRPGSVAGAAYQWEDHTAGAGEPLYYWLESVDQQGQTELHGPVSTAAGAFPAAAEAQPQDRRPEETQYVLKNYYLGGEHVAHLDRLGQYAFLHGDHLGSNRLATFADGPNAGTVVPYSRTAYAPFGAKRTDPVYAWPTSQYWFTGQYYHTRSNLYQMGARWYDPILARWTSADTLVPEPGNPQSLNRYSYTLNNPVRFRDPSGHSACLECVGVGVGVGGPVGAQTVTPGLASQAGQALNVAVADAQAFCQSLNQQLGNLIPAITDQFANPGQASSHPSGSAGASSGGMDPNNWGSKQEQIVRQSLAKDYQQVYGTSDAEIRQGLGIQGKVADFVGYNSQQGRWLIAESKGGDMYKAVQQLQNTMQGALNKTGATTANIDLRIYTSSSNMLRLLGSEVGLGGYRVRDGFLGYVDESGHWVWELINGVRVSVQVHP